MAPSKIRKAIGAVKDQTSIGLAKVSSNTVSDLDVAIVKATRHDEQPAEERHIREILSLTCYSRAYVSACVGTLSRRLGKTRSWTVALKTLILVHRLLSEGDPAYEQEIFFSTRRGTRMLNVSDFRDTSRSDAWDFSAFVRTYALYLDERLEFRMHGRRTRRSSRSSLSVDIDDEEAAAASSRPPTPVREMKTDRLLVRTQHLQQLLERFLACRPTGAAKSNRIVSVALYPLVKESFQIYLDLVELINIFIDRFAGLDLPECVKVYDVFCRLAKQFDDLDAFYQWCRAAGVGRLSDYPAVDLITPQKLDVMDDFIRSRSASNARRPLPAPDSPQVEPEYNMNAVKALLAPETPKEKEQEVVVKEPEAPESATPAPEPAPEEELDLLNLREDALTGEEHAGKLALALFDCGLAPAAAAAPEWEAFGEEGPEDWETALVESAGGLAGQRVALGGGFDMTLLDGMYIRQAQPPSFLGGGSASSVALPAPHQAMLALPAPPVQGGAATAATGDPFAASLAVPAPSYVQMSDMERKQHLLAEEQAMWQQYARDGMQGQLGLARLHQSRDPTLGAYTRNGF